jgi:hypothetical protein
MCCFEVLDVLFLRAAGFFCSLDVIHGGLEENRAIFDPKNMNLFSTRIQM